jgi:hypothetical protein
VPVGSGNHQDLVAGQAVIASEDIGGQVGPGKVSQVKRTRGVGPGDSDKDVLAHEGRRVPAGRFPSRAIFILTPRNQHGPPDK